MTALSHNEGHAVISCHGLGCVERLVGFLPDGWGRHPWAGDMLSAHGDLEPTGVNLAAPLQPGWPGFKSRLCHFFVGGLGKVLFFKVKYVYLNIYVCVHV